MGVNPNDGSEFPLGWVNLNLVDYNGNLRMGVTSLNLWPGEKANPIGTQQQLVALAPRPHY
jgi:hypothetical protein